MRVLPPGRNIQRVPNPTFGGNVKRLRESRVPRITQEELASALELERNAQISTWETSEILPRPDTIVSVAEAFSKLLGREVQPRELLAGVITEYDKLRGINESDPLGQLVTIQVPTEVPNEARDRDDARDYARLYGELVTIYDRIGRIFDTIPEPRVGLPATNSRTGTGDHRPEE